MLSYRTQGYQGYGVKYSPFFDSRLACAASANFGLVGNGRLYVLQLTPQGIIAEKWYDTQDSLFDVAFSENHSNQLAVASGDGSVKLFDTTLDNYPIQQWKEHGREVFSISWNLVDKNIFATSSWDGNVKIWAPGQAQASLRTFNIQSCTYSCAFQPSSPTVLSAVSSDGILRILDLRAPETAYEIVHARVSPGEILCQDWNKYRPEVLATAGVDRVIRTWDVRNTGASLSELVGHEYAVRRIAWSPHWSDVLISASYDMSVRVWTDGSAPPTTVGIAAPRPSHGRMLGVMDKHTEFCAGVDWCLFGAEGWAASTGWDEMVWVWDVGPVIGSR